MDDPQQILEAFQKIPESFPRHERTGAIPGTQPKLLASRFLGKYYPLGCSPPEVIEDWLNCNELVVQLQERALASAKGKRSHMSHEQILEYYLDGLIKMDWVCRSQAHWILQRVAEELGWSARATRQDT